MIGIGTDIVEIRRIGEAVDKLGERFVKRILIAEELKYFKSSKYPIRYLAKRFAAKEAASKSLGTGISGGVSFQDFFVDNNDLGKPTIELMGKALEIAKEQKFKDMVLSLSDEREYVVAFAVLY
ncbi:MAG: holo-ACP synthase [Pseudomonadota bacterium]